MESWFHHFHDEKHPLSQGSMSIEDMDRMINYLDRDRILNADEFTQRYKENKLTSKDLCITFDDALLCQKDVALPVLDHYGIKAFFFVYSSIFNGKIESLEICRHFRTVLF